MTNAEFNKLSPEEVVAYFKSLGADEVETLTKDQKAAYETYQQSLVEAGGVEGNDVTSRALDYFKNHPQYQYESILVSTDGSVFYPTLKGRNAAENHAALNKTAIFEVKKG